MRRIGYLAIAAVIVMACGSNPNNRTQGTKENEPTDTEKFEPTDEELFAACAELTGIGQYNIGTTFKALLKNKEFTSNVESYNRQGTFHSGHWGEDFWNKKTHKAKIYDDYEEAKYLEKKLKGKIRQIHTYTFKIGELGFKDFDMAFLNDTLVAIWFYPNDKDEEAIVNHFIEKYGNGRGKSHESKSSYGDTYISNTDIEHLWANEQVALEYKKYEYFRMEKKEVKGFNHQEHMFIYSKSRYPVFEKTLMDCIDQQIEDINNEKQKSLSTL